MSETGTNGENLIFMISQPRAGSTLLQRMLGGHPDVHTQSEPWLMLHPLYALRETGLQADYDAFLANFALKTFLSSLPNGPQDYLEGVRRMYSYLYRQQLSLGGKRLFLDKTPRYYFIIPELRATFPAARIIILFRNPLAVLCSIIKTWVATGQDKPPAYRHDLLTAPHLMVQGALLLKDRCMVVRYEECIQQPEQAVGNLCRYIGIPFTESMIDYGSGPLPHWPLGDQHVYQHSRPVADKVRSWEKSLADPQVWRLANDYLLFLGSDLLGHMGYSFDALQAVLDSSHPSEAELQNTYSLQQVLGAGR